MATGSGVGGEWSVVALVMRRWPLLLAVTVVCGAAGFLVSSAQQTRYSSTATLLLNDPSSSSVFSANNQTVVDPSRYVRGQAAYITSNEVMTAASKLLQGRFTPDGLRSQVSASASDEFNQVSVTGTDSTAQGAADLANGVAMAYRTVIRQRVQANARETTGELDHSVSQLRSHISDLDQQLAQSGDGANDPSISAARQAAATQLLTMQSRADEISVDTARFGDGVALFDRGEPPSSPSSPKPLGDIVIGTLLGLVLGGGVVWWRGEYRRRADEKQDASMVLGAALLGEIPEFVVSGDGRPLPAALEPHSPAAEAYNILVESVGFALRAVGGRVISITSARPGDGKTVTTLNLAIAMARDDCRVAVVDADERMRGLSRLADAASAPGLSDLGGELPVGEAVRKLDGVEGLDVVPAGGFLDDPAAFFRTGRFRRAIGRLCDRADIVVIDSPPLLAVSDAAAIAAQADAVVVVVERGTPLRVLEEVRHRLDFVGTPLLGYVFNRSASPELRYGRYGYGRYGGGHRGRRAAALAGGTAVPAQRSAEDTRARARR
ncbi:AAA family ATPase [Frankia sp. AgB1.9]|nr:AAA family ATPase [Frankia sp. AgW1.1]MBL7553461.1 AAA family ATPase [Frankia sp. AgB1.9]MBL7622314.1 AAA family ATPase [Frankia sp. AgB1.8]